jgi:PAS domain S-box-containing protein
MTGRPTASGAPGSSASPAAGAPASAHDAAMRRASGGAPAREPDPAPPAEPDIPVNILLVDDRPENLLALEAILEPLGQHLVRATSGEQALKELLRRSFAVILLDVQMPGMNGFELAELIKSRERTRAIPIIFLTAISKEDTYVFRGYQVGAVDYMSKPFQPDILRSKVAVFVDLFRKQEQLRQQEEALRASQRRELELQHQAVLRETEARMAEVVTSALDAIIVFGDDRRITLFNAAAERMFGLPASEAIGAAVSELFPDSLRDEQVDHICGAPGEGSAESGEAAATVTSLTGRRRSGEEFPIEASVSCLTLDDGRSFTLIVRDVTERKRQEEALRTQAVSLARTTAELKVANEELYSRQLELERAMNARNRFYASMSHELRTPINAIIGYNTLLLDNIYGPLNDRQIQGLQRTHKAARHLLELVNDVLDLSKIEAGKIELSLQPVSFPGMIEDLFVTVRPLADEHGTPLELMNEGDETRTVVTDPRRVRQILLNLLSNAIKFGKRKPIQVELSTGRLGGVQVDVVDHGAGIDAKDLPRVFDEFVQLAHGDQVSGTGLGLPISKRLAVLLSGALEAESSPGQGSRFRLLLPPEVDGGRPAREAATREPGGKPPATREPGVREGAPRDAGPREPSREHADAR